MTITVRHDKTEIVVEMPQARTSEQYSHPIGAPYSDNHTTVENSPVLQRLLKLIEVTANKVIDIENRNTVIFTTQTK
jgi:hypothetical protein